MAITKLNRTALNLEFRDGERPSGDDFASAWLSCINVKEDGVDKDLNGNLVLSAGLKLNGINDANLAGTLRFSGGQLQFHDGASFKNLNSGASGAFLPVGAGPHVSFGGGNVGIGAFAVAPTHKLEIPLAVNTGTDQRVKFGNLIVHNGPVAFPGAYASHTNQGGDNNFALLQDNVGNTTLNAASGAQLTLTQDRTNIRFRVGTTGDITISPFSTAAITGNVSIGLGGAGNARNLLVTGTAAKPGGGPFDNSASDMRVKKDVRPYMEGLEKLNGLKPVVYKFNGKANTPDDGVDYVGLVAQNVREVLPELIIPMSEQFDKNDANEPELLTYQSGPITYMMINAIRELSSRLDNLEKSKTNA
jgi:hypothetical protein